ncbi:MAG: Mur ligase family protein, partial [Bdellovibrionota bacterium]
TVAAFDPTLAIGGRVDSLGGNAKLGTGKYVVAEADESDGSFLHLPTVYSVVTNIDNDHLDFYGTMEAIDEAFINFVGKIPFYGVAIVCGEDAGVRRCLTRLTKPFLTYGFSSFWDIYADDIKKSGLGSSYNAYFRDGPGKPHVLLGRFELSVPGRHNVLNSLAAVAVSLKIGISVEKITEGLRQFVGVKRRFEVRWQNSIRNCAVVDDYGHHPTEIAATLDAARDHWSGRIVTVFQPHRFSRTLHCHDGFLSAFKKSDVLIMTDIYSAGEDPIEGVNSKSLVNDIRGTVYAPKEMIYIGDLAHAKDEVIKRFKDGDMVLCLGAGSITKLADQIAKGLQKEVP